MLKCTNLSDQNRKWILLPNLQQLFTYDSTVDSFFYDGFHTTGAPWYLNIYLLYPLWDTPLHSVRQLVVGMYQINNSPPGTGQE